MVHIPENIQALNSYKPGKPIEEIVADLQLKEWAILWNNENNLGPSPKAIEAIERETQNLHAYPDPASVALRTSIAKVYQCSIENVVVDNGSESLLDNIFRSFMSDGNELLTCEGTFVALYIWAKANNRKLRKLPLGRGYRFDVKRIVESITPETKAIYIANPNNPTGTIITKDELDEMIQLVPKEVLVIIDEAYFSYANSLTDDYPDSFSLRHSNVITLRTFSKAYGLAGMRIGFALGPKDLIEAMTKVKMTFAPSNIAQAAALAALEDQEHMQRALELNKKALTDFYLALHEAELDYIPSYANFVMVDIKTEEKAKQFADELLKKGVFIRHLKAFGLPHCVRISTGTDKENQLFIRSVKRWANSV